MDYYGIKTVGDKPYIWWIADSQHDSWMAFFTYPNKDGQCNAHRLSLYEAIKAYEAIGYRCVKLRVTEMEI